MKLKILGCLVGAAFLLFLVADAQAGAIRYAGKKITQGTTAVAGATSDGAQAAGGGMAAAGRATGSTVKTGTVAVGKTAKAVPGAVIRGGKTLFKAIW